MTSGRQNTMRALPAPTPLFVFGVARSGTSYVYELLKAHPLIRLSYEGRIVKEGFYHYNRFHNLSDSREFFELLRLLGKCEEEEPKNQWILEVLEKHRDELLRLHRKNPSFSHLVEQIYLLPGPVRCWGNKMLRIEFCSQILTHWPDAKILILLRDPRAVYASQLLRFKTRIKYSAIYWTLHSKWIRQNALDSERYLVIRYENLLENAVAELTRIFRFAGLMDCEQTSEMIANKPPIQNNIYKWRRMLSSEQIEVIEGLCFEEMCYWDYEPEYALNQQYLGSLSKTMEVLLENLGSIPLNIELWRRKQIITRLIYYLRNS